MATVDRLANWISEVLAHHMLEGVGDTVVVTNGDDRIVLVSRSGERMGWSGTALIGCRWEEVEHPATRHGDGNRSPAPAGTAERRVTSVRRSDDGWEPVHLVRYATHLPDIGPATVLVLTPLAEAA